MSLNRGVSFGFFPGLPVWVVVVFLLVLGVCAVKTRELWGRIGLTLMILGGVGNLVSRIVHGGVLDDWNFFGLFYNNLADYLIVIGLLVYIRACYFSR